ncbi:nuclear transport factor 2 family protein [Nocardioides sp.]|uniref:nuclear transport factor 2 family protein n=1 Tax=Nocardioides sp. TaxID=35761 RepID=UPI0039E5ED93
MTSSTPAQPADALRGLLDKQEIHELLVRYMRGIDRGDLDLIAGCYLPGATEDHGGLFVGPAADYLASIGANLTHPRALTSHLTTNILIDLDGDSARAESYILAFARVRRPDGVVADTLTCARIVDELARVEDRWGIKHRVLRWDWNHDMDKSETWAFGLIAGPDSPLRRSEKYPHDVLYADSLAPTGDEA